MLAATTQPQSGAAMSMNGTGTPTTQPTTRTGLRPTRSASAPATRFVTAFASPNATRKARAAVAVDSPKTSVARSGTIARSWPTIPPTSALTPDEQRELAGVRTQAEFGSLIRAGSHDARLSPAPGPPFLNW